MTDVMTTKKPGKKKARYPFPVEKALTPDGELQPDIPRERLSRFEPKRVAKHQRHMPDLDDHVISMYARSMSVRENQGHLLIQER